MERAAFRSTARGVVRKTVEGYLAFFPQPLPRALPYSAATVRALDDATAALHRLAGVGRLIPNPALLMGPHVRLEAVLSSRIEGTRSGVGDVLRVEVGQDRVEDDAREVVNYIIALQHGLTRLREDFPMSLRLIREVHDHLLLGVRGGYATPGRFRATQNWIGGGTVESAVFVPPPCDEMHAALTDWERFLHETDLPLLIQLALAHYQFEVIHPFVDDNGRVGRLLIPLVLASRQVLREPLLYLSVFFERHRRRYYDLLLATSQTGDFDPWLQFFLEGVRVQSTDAEERTIRLLDLQARLREDLLAEHRSATGIRLADSLFNRPLVTAKRVQAELGVSHPTAMSAIETLASRGTLVEQTGRRRDRVYFAGEIFDAVYGDVPEAQALTD
jgi:Fic family protein